MTKKHQKFIFALSCGFGGERISRHNQLRDALFDTAVAAGLGPVKEGRFLLPGQDRRPADVLLPYWNGGKDAALDVTVVNPLQRATLPQAAIKPGHALQFAFERKINGAAEDCRREGIDFVPLGVESFGGWHQVATREVEKMERALARHTGQKEGEAVLHLWGRLGVLLQRGNAAMPKVSKRCQKLPLVVISCKKLPLLLVAKSRSIYRPL